MNYYFLKILNKSFLITNTISCELGETITSGIDKIHNLSGEILIPYNQAFVDKLVKNTTNILDGGMVKIEGIFYEDELNDISEFIQVSNISDDKH